MTEAMQTPAAYADLIVAFSAGDRTQALAQFVAAVKDEPSFKLAPASWIADVIVEIRGAA
jgi:hypothetical protein